MSSSHATHGTHERTPLLRQLAPKPPRTHRVWAAVALFAALVLFIAGYRLSADLLYYPGLRLEQSELDASLITTINNNSIASFADEYFLAGPHLMGQNRALAEWTREKLEQYGLEAEIETYEVLRNVPRDHSVRVLNGTTEIATLNLEEDVLKEDPTTGSPDRIPTFHGYGASGNATGQLVYANFGRKQDFDLLEELGISVKDKVVLVRYGAVFRGLKVLGAQDRGAKAVLIFSDPIEDGNVRESNGYKAYPHGPARNPSSVQRGSVQNIALAPGDPTTPGYASKPGVNHSEPIGLPKIPSIPISQTEGRKLLKLLDGRGKVIDGWEGDLKAEYRTGPSELDVEVFSDQEYGIVPIYNVVATLAGVTGERVVLGNHRDAWILGGADPNSGSAALLEVARAFGELAQTGWKPFRTLQFSSWDGEEYGLVGSTEHGEDHAKFLSNHAVAYLNLDVATSGRSFHVGAAPLLDETAYSAAKRVPSPVNSKLSLFDYWAAQESGAKTSPLGSGSDFTVFLDHLGIPSLDTGFSGGKDAPAYHYHSNYDSLHWMKKYGDPTFEFHATIARYVALAALDLTGYSVLPLRTTTYAQLLRSTLERYFYGTHPSDDAKELLQTAAEFEQAAVRYDQYLDGLEQDYNKEYEWWQVWQKLKVAAKVRIHNLKLLYFERSFVYEEGLKNRPFFRHIAFAPGRYTGYSGQVLPGLGEAVEDGDKEGVRKWVEVIQGVLEDVTDAIA